MLQITLASRMVIRAQGPKTHAQRHSERERERERETERLKKRASHMKHPGHMDIWSLSMITGDCEQFLVASSLQGAYTPFCNSFGFGEP